MYRIVELRRAQVVLESLRGTLDGEEMREIIDSLEKNPNPQLAYEAAGEVNGRFFYVGENRKWMVSYEIDEEISTVYVHSIERRLSAGLDPR